MQHHTASDNTPKPRYVTLAQAARETGLSAYDLRLGVLQGRFPYIRAGETNRRVCVEDILAILDEEARRNQEEAAQCNSN
jgi:hypothetical protein